MRPEGHCLAISDDVFITESLAWYLPGDNGGTLPLPLHWVNEMCSYILVSWCFTTYIKSSMLECIFFEDSFYSFLSQN